LAKNKKTTTTITTIDEGVETWTDEECLQQMAKFLDRVDVTTKFVENQDGLITHQFVVLLCGDKAIASEPSEFEWPLQRMPMPEAFTGVLN
jgi:hypothetical protein